MFPNYSLISIHFVLLVYASIIFVFFSSPLILLLLFPRFLPIFIPLISITVQLFHVMLTKLISTPLSRILTY